MAMASPIRKQIVLVVDDEPIVLRAVTAALAFSGFRVVVAENGAAGLEAFMAAPDSIQLVIADVVMPYMGGIEMVKRFREIRPDLKIILMSGYSDAVCFPSGQPQLPMVRKPFLPEDLLRMVLAALG